MKALDMIIIDEVSMIRADSVPETPSYGTGRVHHSEARCAGNNFLVYGMKRPAAACATAFSFFIPLFTILFVPRTVTPFFQFKSNPRSLNFSISSQLTVEMGVLLRKTGR